MCSSSPQKLSLVCLIKHFIPFSFPGLLFNEPQDHYIVSEVLNEKENTVFLKLTPVFETKLGQGKHMEQREEQRLRRTGEPKMDVLYSLSTLQLSNNVAENWKEFKKRSELCLAVTGAEEKNDKVKSSIFLHIVGEEALDICYKCMFEKGESMKVSKMLMKFEEVCVPKRNETLRENFFTSMKKTDDTIEQSVTEFRKLSKTCDFGELTESLVRDRSICGIKENVLRGRLLREGDLTLEKALQKKQGSRNCESISQRAKFTRRGYPCTKCKRI